MDSLSSLKVQVDSKEATSFDELFQQYAVPFERFMDEITTITANPNLVLKINNRYMNWASASPIILSAILYQKSLPSDAVNMVLDTHMPKAMPPVATASVTSTSVAATSTAVTATTATTASTVAGNEKKSGWNLNFWVKKAAPTPTQTATVKQESAILTATTTTTTTTTTTVTLAQSKSSSTLRATNSKSEFDAEDDEELVALNQHDAHTVTFDMDPPMNENATAATTLQLKKTHTSKETLGRF